VLDRLRMLMARVPVTLDCGTKVAVTCSIGVAQMVPGRTVTDAIAAADRALYAAKDLGRNRVEVAPPPLPKTGFDPTAAAGASLRGVVRH
jgi:diguanylate cyclase (GGDEF)-like protein